MKCSNCGTKMDGDEKFCGSCGEKFEVVEAPRDNSQREENDFNQRAQEKQYSNQKHESYENQQTYSNNINRSKPGLGNFFKFDRMITPSIIQIIFYIGIAVSAIISLGVMAIDLPSTIIPGIFLFLVLSLVMRVNCELIIVIFKIHETLVQISDK